ncbi:hypothetical protein [Nocardia rhizosphaerihabitans]|uniref:Uncharacterized protein n=1 Tax=Nocardia rhizosphaerihabitans TaxID=1691570 RepID=A0ABQ2KGH7_9NOCA|nr:hypothetical protein [Nocardia rhizosphaerihabitans]GGN82418.1 hypothetical protein GCM10011610_33840 [Nocardia rhizosphaerihabitans]
MNEQRGVYYEEAVRRQPHDPLTLCVVATVALLTWLIGPWAVLGFGVLAFVGYWRAWRAGLRRSRCWLRDTRLVLVYLAAIVAIGMFALLR